jgi:hypothetical protein
MLKRFSHPFSAGSLYVPIRSARSFSMLLAGSLTLRQLNPSAKFCRELFYFTVSFESVGNIYYVIQSFVLTNSMLRMVFTFLVLCSFCVLSLSILMLVHIYSETSIHHFRWDTRKQCE